MPAQSCNLLVDLTFWKTEYLIAQLRTGIWRKVIRVKTCPQGVLEAQLEKLEKNIFTRSYFAWLTQNSPLKVFLLNGKSERFFWSFKLIITWLHFLPGNSDARTSILFEQNMAIFVYCASEQRRTRLVLDFHIGTPTFTQGKQVLHGHHHTPIMTLELPVSLTLAIRPRTV